MYFDSFSAMLNMDGHGGYVWAAYGIALIVIAVMVISPVRRQRAFLTQLKGDIRRQQAGAATQHEDR